MDDSERVANSVLPTGSDVFTNKAIRWDPGLGGNERLAEIEKEKHTRKGERERENETIEAAIVLQTPATKTNNLLPH